MVLLTAIVEWSPRFLRACRLLYVIELAVHVCKSNHLFEFHFMFLQKRIWLVHCFYGFSLDFRHHSLARNIPSLTKVVPVRSQQQIRYCPKRYSLVQILGDSSPNVRSLSLFGANESTNLKVSRTYSRPSKQLTLTATNGHHLDSQNAL